MKNSFSMDDDFNNDGIITEYDDDNYTLNKKIIKCLICQEELKLTKNYSLNKKIHLCIDDNKYYHKNCYNFVLNGSKSKKIPKYGQFNEL